MMPIGEKLYIAMIQIDDIKLLRQNDKKKFSNR